MQINKGDTLTMPPHQTDHLLIDETEHGKGVIADKDLRAGTMVSQISGPRIDYKATLKLGKKESYCLQIGDDEYILPEFPFYLFNHSCNPNCGINKNLELVTIRPVSKGEELRWDYSTSMLEKAWVMECECGEDHCRKIIKDFNQLPIELQNRYLDLKIVMPFILDKLPSRTNQIKPLSDEHDQE